MNSSESSKKRCHIAMTDRCIVCEITPGELPNTSEGKTFMCIEHGNAIMCYECYWAYKDTLQRCSCGTVLRSLGEQCANINDEPV